MYFKIFLYKCTPYILANTPMHLYADMYTDSCFYIPENTIDIIIIWITFRPSRDTASILKNLRIDAFKIYKFRFLIISDSLFFSQGNTVLFANYFCYWYLYRIPIDYERVNKYFLLFLFYKFYCSIIFVNSYFLNI